MGELAASIEAASESGMGGSGGWAQPPRFGETVEERLGGSVLEATEELPGGIRGGYP